MREASSGRAARSVVRTWRILRISRLRLTQACVARRTGRTDEPRSKPRIKTAPARSSHPGAAFLTPTRAERQLATAARPRP